MGFFTLNKHHININSFQSTKKEGTENRLGSRIFSVSSVDVKKHGGGGGGSLRVLEGCGVYFVEREKTNKATEKETVAWATTCGKHCDTWL